MCGFWCYLTSFFPYCVCLVFFSGNKTDCGRNTYQFYFNVIGDWSVVVSGLPMLVSFIVLLSVIDRWCYKPF